jgi:hypothetical protein
MCDPSTLAIASLASTAIGAAGSVASGMGAARAQKKQAAEVGAWQQEQKRFRQAEGARQEGLRQQADVERMAGLEQLDADAQVKRQADEEARLAAYLQGDNPQAQAAETTAPVSVADAALSGQSQGPADFRSDLAAKINSATKDARARMQALAGVSSYGESFGGLGRTNQDILGRTGAGIDKFNEFRRGSIGAWGAEKAIDPVQVSFSDPLAGVFSTALQVGSQGLGNWAGGQTGSFPAAPKAQPAIIGGDPWSQMRGPQIGPIVNGPWGAPKPQYRPTFNGRTF